MNSASRWTSVAATLMAVALLTPNPVLAQASQLIINRGPAQQASVTLETDSSVNIDPLTGNVIVDCAPSLADPTQCADPLGGGNPPPAFSIAAQNFSNPPVGGLYPPLTTFNLAPVGTLSSTYEACQRIQTGTGAQTSWLGLALPSQISSTVQVGTPNASYNFSLRCFAEGGARTSNVVSILTGAGGGGTPGCPSFAAEPWGTFARRTDRTRFPELRRLTGGFASNFPRLLGLAIMVVNRAEYISVQFQALPLNTAGQPDDINGDGTVNAADFNSMLRLLTWIEGQSGEGGGSQLSGTYFTISKCMGDFRLPPENNIPDPSDPTLNLGCRNIRLSQGVRSLRGSMAYEINAAPSNAACALAYGETYFLNMITINPLDGYGPTEHNCIDTVNPRCGVQFQSQ